MWRIVGLAAMVAIPLVLANWIVLANWGGEAAQPEADRISALEQRVANLERTLLLGEITIACTEGEIVGGLTSNLGKPNADPNGVTLSWKPTADEGFGPISLYGLGRATLRGCTFATPPE